LNVFAKNSRLESRFAVALAAGYNKAFWTIFDSQLTTAISGVILIILGTGSVKGFA
jgi:preprotein translocase subunit SecD